MVSSKTEYSTATSEVSNKMDFIITKNVRMEKLLENGIDFNLKNYFINLFQPPNSNLCL